MVCYRDQASSMVSQTMDYNRKRKSRSRKDGTSCVAETIAKWKEYNIKFDSLGYEAKPVRKAPAKGSKKGCMKGKGGPENARCNYRGVRQRTWGKWCRRSGSHTGEVGCGWAHLTLQMKLLLLMMKLQEQCMGVVRGLTFQIMAYDSKAKQKDGEIIADDWREAGGTPMTTSKGKIKEEAVEHELKKETLREESREESMDTEAAKFFMIEKPDYIPLDPAPDREPRPLTGTGSHGAQETKVDHKDLSCQLQHPNEKLLGDLPHMEAAIGFDHGIDFLRPGRPEDYNLSFSELSLELDPDHIDLSQRLQIALHDCIHERAGFISRIPLRYIHHIRLHHHRPAATARRRWRCMEGFQASPCWTPPAGPETTRTSRRVPTSPSPTMTWQLFRKCFIRLWRVEASHHRPDRVYGCLDRPHHRRAALVGDTTAWVWVVEHILRHLPGNRADPRGLRVFVVQTDGGGAAGVVQGVDSVKLKRGRHHLRVRISVRRFDI
ncbi:UNVERIFIED_CONTAM: Dehydration-responsive element-binding protein 2A [Sesamum calycinum]|uniref:Dehydration-responsive element-binding protein 2A n=1 Tax=Sesamum calycinum TaxID=2727403 RepID=A0AAW2RPS2_9LAMI